MGADAKTHNHILGSAEETLEKWGVGSIVGARGLKESKRTTESTKEGSQGLTEPEVTIG